MLQGKSGNDLVVRISIPDGAQTKIIDGPIIQLRHSLAYLHHEQEHRVHLGLEIGIPLAVAVFALIGFLAWFFMRKRKAAGKGPLFGRARGYGERKSYAQRTGLSGKGAAVGADEQEVPADGVIRRGSVQVEEGVELETQRQRPAFSRKDTDANNPFADPVVPQSGRTNVFREEIERQRTGRPLQ